MVFRCPNIQAHCNEAVLCLNFGTPENNEFSIWDKWKNLLSLGVPIFKHIRVSIAVYLKRIWIIFISETRQVNVQDRSTNSVFPIS